MEPGHHSHSHSEAQTSGPIGKAEKLPVGKLHSAQYLVALILASASTHGLTIQGVASWVAVTIVVWLVTTVGAISLPEVLVRDPAGSTT